MSQRTGSGERIQLPDPEIDLALPKLEGDRDAKRSECDRELEDEPRARWRLSSGNSGTR
jgi:hypothetical protein